MHLRTHANLKQYQIPELLTQLLEVNRGMQLPGLINAALIMLSVSTCWSENITLKIYQVDASWHYSCHWVYEFRHSHSYLCTIYIYRDAQLNRLAKYVLPALHRVSGVQLQHASKNMDVRLAVLDAVNSLHQVNITHGDLRPSNILVEMMAR